MHDVAFVVGSLSNAVEPVQQNNLSIFYLESRTSTLTS